MTDSARARALRLLARREHSRAELAGKLSGEFRAEEVAAALDALERDGYLSDARFAESFIAARSARFGTMKLRHELASRGVAPSLIDAALGELRAGELARAREVWRKRFDAPGADLREQARQARFLQARGFSAEIVRRVLREAAE